LADRKCIVEEPPLGQMARQRRTAVSKPCTRSQTRPLHPRVTETYFPEVRESCTRKIGKENGHLECGLERERAEKTEGVEGQGEERDLAERENEEVARREAGWVLPNLRQRQQLERKSSRPI